LTIEHSGGLFGDPIPQPKVARMLRPTLALVLAMAGASRLTAQQPAAGITDNSRPVLVRAARYLDVDKGVYVSPAVILVDSGRIAGINPKKVSPDYPVVDLGNMTLMPGLIDLHTHLTFENGPDWATEPVTRTAADRAMNGVINGRKTLLAGFTTVRDVGSSGFADVALARGIANGGIPARAWCRLVTPSASPADTAMSPDSPPAYSSSRPRRVSRMVPTPPSARCDTR
jgi:imidazolonepropionase-like amidohydrolase